MSKVQRVGVMKVFKGAYFVKGYSTPEWWDDKAKKSTRQILKRAIKQDAKKAYGLEL